MPLDTQSTTLRQSPYYDDYDETKNFHRVLFKPSVAVQARELTQLQTILQNQIERFGDNVYQTGTIIKGCSLVTDDQYYYVKLFDLQPNGQNYNLASLANTYIVEPLSGLMSLVVNTSAGGQQLDPDLNTLYLKYLNTGSNSEKQYSNNAVLTAYNRNYQVESINVANGGTLYSNSDVVVFTNTSNSTGSGAVAQIVTYANGTIRSVNVVIKGSGYVTAPTATISTSTGSGASLNVYNYIAQVQVANSVYNAGGTSSPVGRGTAIKTSEGIIYQKGNFVRVEAHEQILSKYDTNPTGVSVGFVTRESIVNSNADTTLLDNASTTTNYTAPGADRLKLTANLVVLSTTAAAANNDFLSLYEYEDGRVVKDRTQTQFNSISKELSRRTYEESGNYVVSQFPMYAESISGNNTHLNLNVGAGVAYVRGNRVQLVNSVRYPIRKSTDTQTLTTQTISTNYGGYVYVNELMGTFDVTTGATVTLYNDTTTQAVTIEGTTYNRYGRLAITSGSGIGAPSGGVSIGSARVRSLVYDSGIPGTGDCKYRLYLFDVKMSSGYSFKDVRSVLNGSSGVADVIQDAALGYSTQYDQSFDTLLFSTGTFAVRQLDNEVVIIRSSISGSPNQFTPSAGQMEISLSGGAKLPYSENSVLNSIQERDFIIVPAANIISTNTHSGTVTATSGANTLVGTSTKFSTEYGVGDYIRVGNTTVGEIALITKIVSNTSLQVATNWGSTWTANTHRFGYPANVPINFSSTTRTIEVVGNNVIRASLGHPIVDNAPCTTYFDYKLNSPSVRNKTVGTYYTKISTAAVGSALTGPWSIGVPDVISLEGVYVGSANDYATAITGTNRAAEFILNNGQTDNSYDVATFTKRPGSSLALGPNSCLVVKYKAFTAGAGSYVSTESYTAAIDDTTSPVPPNRIRTQQIPVFVSPKTGKSYDLRDTIDFRPTATNTAAYATTLDAATVDPAREASSKFGSTDKAFPSPTREFSASIDSYLARTDRVIIDQYGEIHIIEGYPSNSPSAPIEPEGSMTIGIVNVPQYPTLSAKDAADTGRPDLGTYIVPQQNRRYTMKDISDIESRIGRLEYYTLLNTLETNTKQLVLPSEANNSIERFKNGFFVDPLTDYNVSNLQDPEYRVMIDPARGIARPYSSDAKIDLQYSPASADVVQTGDLITLGYTEKVLLNQPISTRDRTLVDQFWRYSGTVRTIPAYDNFYDVERAGVSIAVDIASPLTALAQATAAALSQLTVSTNLLSTANVGSAVHIGTTQSGWTVTNTYQQNINKTLQDTKVTIGGGQTYDSNTYLGQYVNDFSLQQYIKEQRIAFITTGLRPNARHYVYFDGTPVSNRVTPAVLPSGTSAGNPAKTDFVMTGTVGSALYANSTGCVAGFLDIPGSTYFVGERSLVIMDVDNVESESTATSKSIGKYSSYSFNMSKTDLTLSTKSVDTGAGKFTTQNYLSSPYVVGDSYLFSTSYTIVPSDPLGQTFLVQPQLDSTDGVYLTSIDVFFKTKDPSLGVTLEIRETSDSGAPTSTVVPFSRSYLPSANVNISSNASLATRFTFPSPVYVKAGGRYAIVMYPDAASPEYRVFSSVVGGRDLTNTNTVSNQNWGLGTLYYSTSGSDWTAVQDEDLKFTINRALFNTYTGTAVLNNGDYEFVTVNNAIGTFRGGEVVAQLHPNTYVSTANVLVTTAGSPVLSTKSSLTGQVAVGDNILMIYGTTLTLSSANVNVSGTTVSNIAGSTAAFTTEYLPGDFIKIGNTTAGEIRQVVSTTTSSITIDSPLSTSASNTQHYRMSPQFQVAQVKAANSTSLTINKPARLTTASDVQVQLQKSVVGVVDNYNYSNNRVYIANSTSTSDTFKMYAANSSYRGTLIGDTTNARADVVSLDDVNVNFFRPAFNTIYIPGTGLSFDGTLTKSGGSTNTMTYELGALNKVNFNDAAVVKSKSNEIVGSVVNKSFTATLDFSTSSKDISPALDAAPTSIIVTRNIIDNYTSTVQTANIAASSTTANTNTSGLALGMGIRGRGIPSGTYITSIVNGNQITMSQPASATAVANFLTFHSNENTRYGINRSKYISKRLELAEGMDAEDVKVFLTAYKPTGTSIDVYARIMNFTDGEQFNEKDWTLLDQVTAASLYSDSLNEEDYREFEFTFPKAPPATRITGFASVTSGSTTVTGVDSTFLTDLAVGDLIKVVRTSNTLDYDIVRVSAIASDTSLTTTTPVSVTATGTYIEKVDQPKAAFKYCRNNNVVRYHNAAGAAFDTYKYLAIKVVLRSPYNYLVPTLNDVRALAVSV